MPWTGRGSKKPSSRDERARRLNACGRWYRRGSRLSFASILCASTQFERFEKLVADYNAGSMNTETFFQELLKFSDTLTEEEARALAEGLNEEQLAIFDLLMRPAPELSEDEKSQVKRVAEDLLAILKPTRSSSTGGSSRARGRRCALPWRRSWTGCRRSSRASSTPRSVMGCTSTFR